LPARVSLIRIFIDMRRSPRNSDSCGGAPREKIASAGSRDEHFAFFHVSDFEASLTHRMRHAVQRFPARLESSKEGTTMFRRRSVFAYAAVAAFLLAAMLSPRAASAKNSKTINATMYISSPTSLGGKPVKAGTYSVIAGDSTVQMKSGNKVVAEAPVQWKDAGSKAGYSSIVTDAQGIKEIHFSGKSRYIEVTE
jgi:hypothetical protein